MLRVQGIDITASDAANAPVRIKLKADPYFGVDPVKIANRSLPFYRSDAGQFAFESVADGATREPGWVLSSEADSLYYYYLVLAHEPDELRSLLAERDETLFARMRVERDELLVMPMKAVRRWFVDQAENHPSRPVLNGGSASWSRLVPKAEVLDGVEGVRIVGSVFPGVAG